MQGILTVAANNDKQKKTNCFQVMDDSSAVCWNQLSWLVENDCKCKKRPFVQFWDWVKKNSFTVGCRTTKTSWNDKVEQFGHYMWKWMSYFHCFTGPYPWTCWEEGRVGHFFSHSISEHKNFKNPCILSLPTRHKFPCDGISLLLWLYKHEVWHLSHYYLKFTLKYWNFWKHCF